MDCTSLTEAAFLPAALSQPTDISDYHEELMMSLTSAKELALTCIKKAQFKYKRQHDKKAVQRRYRLGDWVLVRFPQDESGKNRKLSRPWLEPY